MKKQPRLRVGGLEVIDSAGHPRIVLGVKDDQPALELLDSGGQVRASLHITPDLEEPTLLLMNPAGEIIIVCVDRDGTPQIRLLQPGQDALAVLTTAPQPRLVLKQDGNIVRIEPDVPESARRNRGL
jgi:hypothetical protein